MLFNLSIIWSLIHILIIFIFLYESRYSFKKTLINTSIWMGLLIVFNVLSLLFLGSDLMGKIFLLTCTVPSLFFFLFMAKERNGKFFFTFCLADTISAAVLVTTNLMDYYLGGGRHILLFILRLIAFPALEYFIWKRLRRPYLEIQNTISDSWNLFTAMAAIFYLILSIFPTWPKPILERQYDVPVMILILLLLPLTYSTIFLTLYQQLMRYRDQENKRLLEAQTIAIEKRAEMIQETSEKIRIERHDLRHRFQGLSVMLEKGDIQTALEYIGAAQNLLDEKITVRYCNNAILDAILSAYIDQAKEAEIQITAKLNIPDDLPVDAAELSTVFANALENAIHACCKLPVKDRKIVCKCVASPAFIFEIANTSKEDVIFNEKGLPVSFQMGHGFGIHSILAFTQKYNAVYSFRMEDGWFKLQIAI